MLLSSYEKKTDKLLSQHLQVEEKLLKLLESETINYKDFKSVISELRTLHNKSDDKNIELDIIRDREINPDLLDSYHDLYSHVETVQNILKKEQVPAIQLSKIIRFLNSFSEHLLHSNNQLVLESHNQNTCLLSDVVIPLSLKSGRKVLLHNRNLNFEDFTYSELVEILRVLDILVKDNEFDYLRTKITEQLANISSFSLPKLKEINK